MTTRMILKQWNDILVPAAGEIVVEQGTNKIKIGDGKTNFANLPYVEDNPPEMTLSEQAKEFIENNIEYLEANDYDTFYSHIATSALAQEVTRALLKADLNPKPHLSKIPQSIRHILEPDEVWVEDTSRLYTKAEVGSMMQYSQADMSVIDEWNKKLFMQIGIPAHLMTIKTGG